MVHFEVVLTISYILTNLFTQLLRYQAGSVWKKIEQWCVDEDRSGALGGDILSSLSPGRALDPNSHGRIPNAQTSATKAVYAFYAGQCDPMMVRASHYPALQIICCCNIFTDISWLL